MKISKLKIENFRLLKNIEIDLEQVLSLIIGKNNSGKTSLLTILNKFINNYRNPEFTIDDFNIDFINSLKLLVNNNNDLDESSYESIGIKLKLFIEYTDLDYLGNISNLMMDLDPENNHIVLSYEYLLDYNNLINLKRDFHEFLSRESEKDESKRRDINFFLSKNALNYFKSRVKSLKYDKITKREDDSLFIDVIQEKIKLDDIINFQYISAKREVTNKENNKTLSIQTSEIYEKTSTLESRKEHVDNLNEKLYETDVELTNLYSGLFKDVIDNVKKFGGIKEDDSVISINSLLSDKNLLKGNTTVRYQHQSTTLPESHNGLGYMNLISMIFHLEILIQNFKRSTDEKPADINLLFIEEPEAHTHPQMQYVFIKNIKNILNKGVVKESIQDNRKIQTIITTHSSHIVSESDFEDIKYLNKKTDNSVLAKNMSDLIDAYRDHPKQYQFLKQYLTLSRAEIFFADKAIFIEGDTERILLPTIMRKMDIEDDSDLTPLLSQNISIIEVGAYSHIFDYFIDFIGLKKGLIITDIDSYKTVNKPNKEGVLEEKQEKCSANDADVSGFSNSSIKYFMPSKRLETLVAVTQFKEAAILKEENQNWINSSEGNLLIVYQLLENGVHSRSFEDAFIEINRQFINENLQYFEGLKNVKHFSNTDKSSFELSNECINKKTHFALDIVMNSNENCSNWEIPSYIKQGLEWLKI